MVCSSHGTGRDAGEKVTHARSPRPGLGIHTVTFTHLSLAKVGHTAKPGEEMDDEAIQGNRARQGVELRTIMQSIRFLSTKFKKLCSKTKSRGDKDIVFFSFFTRVYPVIGVLIFIWNPLKSLDYFKNYFPLMLLFSMWSVCLMK